MAREAISSPCNLRNVHNHPVARLSVMDGYGIASRAFLVALPVRNDNYKKNHELLFIMKTLTPTQLRKRIKAWLILFIVFLVLSGVTAFPIETELGWLSKHSSWLPVYLENWVGTIYKAVRISNAQYPYLSYGTDWLAFAHVVIAVNFIGPLKDPVRNIWVIQFGMIACILIFPLAFIMGPIRHIPVYWQLIDCSFGIIGIIPLYLCYRNIRKLEAAVPG